MARNNPPLKTLLLILFATGIHLAHGHENRQKYSDPQTEFAAGLYKTIRDSNYEKLEESYLSKDELLQLFYKISPDTAGIYQDPTIKNYTDQREEYLSKFNVFYPTQKTGNSRISKFSISKSELTGIKYNYLVVIKHTDDIEIKFPQSKTYSLNLHHYNILEALVSVKSGRRNYTLKLYAVYFEETWKLYYLCPSPKLN